MIAALAITVVMSWDSPSGSPATALTPALNAEATVLDVGPASTVMACGAYVISLGSDEVIQFPGPPPSPDVHHFQEATIRRGAAVVATVHDYDIETVACQPYLTGPTPAIIVTSWSGGGHCCIVTRVYQTEPLQRVLSYDGGTGAQIVAAPGGQAVALFFFDSHYGYIIGEAEGYEELSSAAIPATPLVACFSGTRFRDCTARYPSVIAECEATYSANLERALREQRPVRRSVNPLTWTSDAQLRSAAIGKEMCGLVRGIDHAAEITRDIAAQTQDADLAKHIGTWFQQYYGRLVHYMRTRGDELLRPCGRFQIDPCQAN